MSIDRPPCWCRRPCGTPRRCPNGRRARYRRFASPPPSRLPRSTVPGSAVREISSPRPDNPLHKVVLSRALRLTADAALDARAILRRLVNADPAAYGYLVDLTAAGDDYAGCALVGASPELLVARCGDGCRVPAVRRFGPARCGPGTRRRQRRRAGRIGQGPSRAPTGHRHDARRLDAVVRRPDDRARAALEPHRGGMAPVHADHRQATRHVNHGNRSRVGPASHPGGRRGADPGRNAS